MTDDEPTMEVIGYDSREEFEADLAKWNAEHADTNPMIDQELAQQHREDVIRDTLENLAHAIKLGGLSPLVWSPDEAIEACADSVRLNTDCRQIDAIVCAGFLIEAIAALDINWPPT